MMAEALGLDACHASVGQELGVSRWFEMDQTRIDRFADVTEDHQFIHVDPKAAAATPFGGTIAQGYLTLPLLSAMSYDAIPPIEGVSKPALVADRVTLTFVA